MGRLPRHKDNRVAIDDQDRVVLVNFRLRKMRTLNKFCQLDRIIVGYGGYLAMRRTWREFCASFAHPLAPVAVLKEKGNES